MAQIGSLEASVEAFQSSSQVQLILRTPVCHLSFRCRSVSTRIGCTLVIHSCCFLSCLMFFEFPRCQPPPARCMRLGGAGAGASAGGGGAAAAAACLTLTWALQAAGALGPGTSSAGPTAASPILTSSAQSGPSAGPHRAAGPIEPAHATPVGERGAEAGAATKSCFVGKN